MNRTLKVLFFVVILFASTSSTYAQITYYANTSGNPTLLTNWDDVGDGSGNNPPDFAQADYFVIPTGINMSFSSGTWALTDPGLLGTLGLEIQSGASLTVSGTANVTIAATHSFTLDGNYTHTSTATINRNLISEANNALNSGSNFTIEIGRAHV